MMHFSGYKDNLKTQIYQFKVIAFHLNLYPSEVIFVSISCLTTDIYLIKFRHYLTCVFLICLPTLLAHLKTAPIKFRPIMKHQLSAFPEQTASRARVY